MGVLVLLLSIIKMSGGSQMNLMKAESPGPSVSRLAPTVRSTAKILYTIYLLMTVLETVILLLCGMPVFDALTTAFGTAGTGGFGIKNDSMGGYSVTIQIVVTVFMILFGINFNVYFLLLSKKWKQALKNEEVRWYLAIILGSGSSDWMEYPGSLWKYGKRQPTGCFPGCIDYYYHRICDGRF